MKSQSMLEIVAGDTAGIWKVSHVTSEPGARPVVRADLSAGYACTIKAVDAAGATVVAERAVSVLSSDDLYFLAALNPAETDTIPPGDVTVAIQLSNPSLVPPLRKERHFPLRVHPNINANT